MYEGLVKTLRASTPNRLLMFTAADAIEELSMFREQISDGHIYCMRDGVLYRLNVEPPKGNVVHLPPIEFAEPPKEGEA